MDIALRTDNPADGLEFRNFQRFPDGSGYRTIISVRSGEFSATLPFYFEPHPLKQFLGELETLDRTLRGSATLRPMWEPRPYLSFTVDQRGHVTVAGFLEYGSQEVRFELVTDQTCLRPLLADLRSCVDAPAT